MVLIKGCLHYLFPNPGGLMDLFTVLRFLIFPGVYFVVKMKNRRNRENRNSEQRTENTRPGAERSSIIAYRRDTIFKLLLPAVTFLF